LEFLVLLVAVKFPIIFELYTTSKCIFSSEAFIEFKEGMKKLIKMIYSSIKGLKITSQSTLFKQKEP
tara:strand:+ start:19595 stop:19795 length:201 start_codon:yes stop_codon:yes gene_type:complete